MKKVKKNQLKIVIFTAVKNRCILHGRVFVIHSPKTDPAKCSHFTTATFQTIAARQRPHSDEHSFLCQSCTLHNLL